MLAVKHFFAYLPVDGAEVAMQADVDRAFAAIGYRTQREPYLLGSIPFSTAEKREEELQQHIWTRVTAGTEINTRSELANISRLEDAVRYAGNKLRLFNLIVCEPHALEISSDPLGVLPFYMAEVDGGTLICSSIRHLLLAYPELSREIDEQAVFEFLCCGAPLGPRTFHKRVRLVSAGQVIHCDRDKGLRIDRSNRIRVLPPDPGLGTANAANQVASLIRESFEKLPSPGIITLTGGFDSRLITCFAFEQKRPVRMVTLGYPRFEETQVAQAVASQFGTTTKVFPPPHPDILDLVPLWLGTLEGLADAHTLFIANLLSLPDPDGTPIYHGFIGDTLSGALLPLISKDTATTPEELAGNAAAHFFGGVAPDAAERLRLSASVKAAIQDIQDEMLLGVAPHQTTILWNLENIQRRLVGHQLLYVGQRFMPVPVFYYRPLMEYWLSLPRMALDNRALLAYMYQTRWPKMSTLPHAEHTPTFIPRTRPAVQYLAGWILRRYGWRAARKFGLDVEKFESRSEAWALWHGTTEVQRKKELRGLDETLGVLRSRLGWDAPTPTDGLWSSSVSIGRKQLLMLRRMYLLGEYSKSLPEPVTQSNASDS